MAVLMSVVEGLQREPAVGPLATSPAAGDVGIALAHGDVPQDLQLGVHSPQFGLEYNKSES